MGHDTLNVDAAEFIPLGLEVDWAAMVIQPDYEYVPHMSDGDGESDTQETQDATRPHGADGAESDTPEMRDAARARGAGGAESDTQETQDATRARGAGGAESDTLTTQDTARTHSAGGAESDTQDAADTHGLEDAAGGCVQVPEEFAPLRDGGVPGMHVMVVALRQRADLNIRPGVILEPMTARGRYAVRVFTSSGATEAVSVNSCATCSTSRLRSSGPCATLAGDDDFDDVCEHGGRVVAVRWSIHA